MGPHYLGLCSKLKVKGTFTYVVNAQQKHNLELRSLFNFKVQREGGKWSWHTKYVFGTLISHKHYKSTSEKNLNECKIYMTLFALFPFSRVPLWSFYLWLTMLLSTHTHTHVLDAYFHNCLGVIRFLGHSCFKHSSLKIQWPSLLSRGASEIWEWGLEFPSPVCVSSPMDLLSPIPSEERTSSFPRLLENVLDLNLLLTSPPFFFLPCCRFLACLFVSLSIPSLQTRLRRSGFWSISWKCV